MEETLSSYVQDLDDTLKYIEFTKKVNSMGTQSLDQLKLEEELFKRLDEIKTSVRESNRSATKVPGILLLYICGRFEYYVRSLVEDLAVRTAASFDRFDQLPDKLQNALIKGTSQVIGNHGRYGKSKSDRDIYIKNLSRNIHENDLSAINYECVSATETNMRPSVIKELFSKVDIPGIWDRVCEQNSLKIHFETDSAKTVLSNCTKTIESIMDTRNSVAHPSSNLSWPAAEKLERDIQFLKILGRVFFEIAELQVLQIKPTK